jgi:hypothetical protein
VVWDHSRGAHVLDLTDSLQSLTCCFSSSVECQKSRSVASHRKDRSIRRLHDISCGERLCLLSDGQLSFTCLDRTSYSSQSISLRLLLACDSNVITVADSDAMRISRDYLEKLLVTNEYSSAEIGVSCFSLRRVGLCFN